MIKRAWVLSIYNPVTHYNCTSIHKPLERRGIETESLILGFLSIVDGKFYYNDKPIAAPDIIFCVNQYLQRTDIPNINTRKLDDLTATGIPITSKVISAANAANKWNTFKILSENDVPTPFSILISDETVYDGSIVGRLGSPFVIKFLVGATGRYSSLCYSEHDLQKEFHRLKRVYGADHIIAQEYLDTNAGMIVTVGAVRNCCNRAVIRIGDPNLADAFLGDTKKDRTQIAYKMDKRLEEVTNKVMDVLDLDLARIDMMIHNNDYYVLEANAPGGLNIIDLMHRSNIGSDYVDWALKHYG